MVSLCGLDGLGLRLQGGQAEKLSYSGGVQGLVFLALGFRV